MRIGIVTTSYPRFAGDAAGNFVAAHVDYLRSTGADVEVIAADDGAARPAPDVVRVPAAAGLFYSGGAPDAIEAGASKLAMVRFTAALASEVRRRAHAWDAACAHWWVPCGIAAALAPNAPALPLLAIAHGGDIHVAKRAHVLAPIAATLLMRGARFAFVSGALRQAALGAMPNALASRVDARSIVQPMGIDLDAFRAIRAKRAPRDPATPAVIAIIARLVPIKGVGVAIEAMRHVHARARLIVAGEGPLRADLEARARAARAAGLDVDIVGELGADRRDDLLRLADVLAMPSIELPTGRSEGMPLAVLEAMAAGVPVAASSSGGLADLPADAAHLAPPGDPRALAAAIDRALAQPPTRAARFVESLGWRGVGAKLDEHWGRLATR